MAMSGGGKRGGLNSEINVTPLVDVMLVLLVIFMITAPLMNRGVDLDLPDTNAPPVKDSKAKATISINDKGALSFDTVPISWVDLSATIKRDPRVQTTGELQIQADQALPYGVVVTAMAVAQLAGATKPQLLTDSAEGVDLGRFDRGDFATGAAAAAVGEEEEAPP